MDPSPGWAIFSVQSHASHVIPVMVFLLSMCHRIILLEDAMDCLISFTDFLYAFQIQFYYEGNDLAMINNKLSVMCIKMLCSE